MQYIRLAHRLIEWMFRNRDIENKIRNYRKLTLDERNQLYLLLAQRNRLRELHLLMQEVVSLYLEGNLSDQENIEIWLTGIDAHKAVEAIRQRFQNTYVSTSEANEAIESSFRHTTNG